MTVLTGVQTGFRRGFTTRGSDGVHTGVQDRVHDPRRERDSEPAIRISGNFRRRMPLAMPSRCASTGRLTCERQRSSPWNRSPREVRDAHDPGAAELEEVDSGDKEDQGR